MTCKEALERLQEFLDETLTPELKQAFEKHVGHCKGCPELLESYRKTVALCKKGLMRPAPGKLFDRVMSALRDNDVLPRRKR